MVWWRWCGGDSVVEMMWWRWCGGDGVVEMVWWRWCGGGVVEMVWWRWCGGAGVVEMVWWRWCGHGNRRGTNHVGKKTMGERGQKMIVRPHKRGYEQHGSSG